MASMVSLQDFNDSRDMTYDRVMAKLRDMPVYSREASLLAGSSEILQRPHVLIA
jgi:hypothetical protein